VITITFVLYYQKAMPALLFILPMEMIGIFVAAYQGYGYNGISYLVTFDEEKALKTGQSMAAHSKLPLK
jgi:hypothetical protein